MQKKIVARRVSDLTLNENNARLHTPKQIDQIVNSITTFGFTNPILIDTENKIIAGHGRIEAAKQMELKTVPCIVLADMDEEQLRAYAIADNKIALNSAWDFEVLNMELTDLMASSYDLELIGFDPKELNNIVGDDSTKEKVTTETVTGDRFLLMVEFQKEKDCEKLFNELDERGLQCKILT